jgi:hypothetical protein
MQIFSKLEIFNLDRECANNAKVVQALADELHSLGLCREIDLGTCFFSI